MFDFSGTSLQQQYISLAFVILTTNFTFKGNEINISVNKTEVDDQV